MSKKIIISESQYRRVFLGEQQLDNSKPPKYSSWSSHSIALGCGACSYDSYKKLALEKDGYALPYKEVKSGDYSIDFKPDEVDLKSTNNVFLKPMNTFEIAQSQWRKWGAQNPKTGRNKIPIDQIAALRKSWENARKEWEAQNPTLEDLGTDITIYGDTEQGGIAQSMKASGYRFSDYGWTNAQQDSYRDESLRRIDDLIPYLDAVEYNANIDAQPKLIPQYCKKQTNYKSFYDYVCTTGDCGEVSTRRMNDLKKRQSKYDGMFRWMTPKGKKYGYYLVYRADIGKNPMQFCDNSSSKGVWVYKTAVGYHCGCYQQTNQQYMDDLGTWTENSYLGYIEKVKKHQKENAPGFLESVVEYLGGCFDDYHCILDLMSIAALAIPGVGLAISAGLDIINAGSYGVEAYNADSEEERDAALIAGTLTLFGGLLGGGISQTKRLVTKGNANPKIYKYADEVMNSVNKEIPNAKNLKELDPTKGNIIQRNLNKKQIPEKLSKIYKETAEKYGLKDSEILIAHDILKDLSKIDPNIAQKYTEALNAITKKVDRASLTKFAQKPGFQKMLISNNGDVVVTLSKYMKKVARKEAVMEASLFAALTVAMEQPEVQKWIGDRYMDLKYMGRTDTRAMVEKEGYDWDSTKELFGSDSSREDNEALRKAWEKGWRPQKDVSKSWEWLIKNPKYQTNTFKTKYTSTPSKVKVLPKNEEEREEGIKYYETEEQVNMINQPYVDYSEEEENELKNLLKNIK